MNNQYECPSYYDDNNVLQDCSCGKCANTEPSGVDEIEQILLKLCNQLDKSYAVGGCAKTIARVADAGMFYRKSIGNASVALRNLMVNERLDTIDRIETERVSEPLLFGQNALPLAVVTVSALNNERRRIKVQLTPNQGDKPQ